MKFLLDESADFRLAKYLKKLGHDVTSVVKDHPRAISDQEVMDIARKQKRVLITEDNDFVELSNQTHHSGIILFSLGRIDSIALKTKLLGRSISQTAFLENKLIIVTSRGIRVRQLLPAPDQN